VITNVKKYVNMNYDVQKMLSVDSKVKKEGLEKQHNRNMRCSFSCSFHDQ
jgi:hypothetical protein